GSAAVAALTDVAKGGTNRLARLHAIWGLGQIGRQTPAALDPLGKLATDDDAEGRGQAIKLLGDHHVGAAAEAVRAGLRDVEPRGGAMPTRGSCSKPPGRSTTCRSPTPSRSSRP